MEAASDSKPLGEIRGGSSPPSGTVDFGAELALVR